TSNNNIGIFMQGTSTGSNNISTYTVPIDEWVHITGTYDGTFQRIYVNGTLNARYSQAVGALTGSKYIQIGMNDKDFVTNAFNGQIDEVKIYNYTLTPEQVKLDYNSGAVRFE
ncbi:MAG TPA: LamG domain-containing protein, partial [Candidatus Woesebacteria bacterium]|nr:LamG domain-containing protein [Candidatus Woesebacteria bacterium]